MRLSRLCLDADTIIDTININIPIVKEKITKEIAAVRNPPALSAIAVKPAKIGPVQPMPAAV